MESRIRIFLLKPWHLICLGMMLASTGLSAAEPTESLMSEPQRQVIEPQVERSEIKLDAIDTEDFEVGAFVGFLSIEDFGTNSVYGVRLAYHITEGLFVEGTYALSEGGKTSLENFGITVLTEEQRKYTYYNISLGYNLLPGEAFLGRDSAHTTALYVVAGMGNTDFAGDERFTVNFGVGYRFLSSDWLAFHVDMRDHMFDIDLLGVNKTAHNLELSFGATIFF